MRKILTKDMFALARILKKSKVKEELLKIDLEKANQQEIGMQILFTLLEAGGTAEQDVYALVESIAETENVAEMPITDFINIIKSIAKENDLLSFFNSATQLT